MIFMNNKTGEIVEAYFSRSTQWFLLDCTSIKNVFNVYVVFRDGDILNYIRSTTFRKHHTLIGKL